MSARKRRGPDCQESKGAGKMDTNDRILPPLAVAHSQRFRRVANRYPCRVAEAYGADIERAANDDDATVAATVAAWEAAHGLQVRDWYALGRAERADDIWIKARK